VYTYNVHMYIFIHTVSLTLIGCLEGEMMEEEWDKGGGRYQLNMSYTHNTTFFWSEKE
jgi:hypothetical protein